MAQINPKLRHPYLFFNAAWVERFRQSLANNPALRREWECFVLKTEKLLGEKLTDESYADGNDSQHGNYGEPAHQIAKMGMMLGLAYQVTGDIRFAEKLKEALLQYSQYVKWYGKGLLRNDPPWHSELNTANFCFGFAVGYDCIYDLLDEAERSKIKDALVRLGVLPILQDWVFPETRIHALDSMGHNWWNVMIPLAGVGVIAVLNEEPQAQQWLDTIVTILPEYFAYKGSVLGNKSPNYDESGGFYESVLYANYGLSEYLAFRIAYQETFGYTGFEDIPILQKTGDFFLHTTYPSKDGAMTVNFGDGLYREGVAKSVKLLLANRWEDPRLRWYLSEWKAEYDAYDFMYYDRIREGERRQPDANDKSAIYRDIGWAVVRDDWNRDSTMLAVKSGFTWNHAHADAGSFILFHRGKPLLIDSGNCEYGLAEYRDYYSLSHAHNVALFNGNGQEPDDLYRGVKEPGQLYHMVNNDAIRYVYADATGPMSRYLSRNFRHYLWVDGVILIIDDIRAHEKGTVQWLLHYDGEASKISDSEIKVTNGEAQVGVRQLFPRDVKLVEKTGLADHDPNSSRNYLSFETQQPSKETKIITAIVPACTADGLTQPHITLLEEHEMIGVRIVRDGTCTDVLLNLRADGRIMHRNSIRTLRGWETDAYLLAISRPLDASEDDWTAVERCFIGYGSFLRREGRPLYSSMSKATVSMSFKGEQLSVNIQGQPTIRAEICPAVPPKKVIVNGKLLETGMDDGIVTVRCMSRNRERRPG